MTFYNIKSKLISLVVSEKKLVIVLLIFGGLLRACIVINAYIDKIWTNFEDDRARIEFSNKIIEKGVIFEILDYKSPEAIFAPWVPFIITGKTLLFGEDLFVLFILNAILGTLTCLIIFYIAKMYFQNSVAILSLFWSCVYVNYLRYTATAGNEIWLVFFFVLTGFFALKIMDGNAEAKNLIGLGLSLTLLSHTDERYLAYIFLFPLLTYFTPAHVKSKSKKMLIVLGVIFLLSLPWQIRNYIVYKDIVLISVRTTNITKLFIDHAPDLVYKHDKDKNYLTAQQIDSISNGLLYTFPDGRKLRPGQFEAMKKGNLPHKFGLVEKYFSRLYFLWLPFKFNDNYRKSGFTFEGKWSFLHNVSSIFFYGLLLPFTLFGFINFNKSKKNIFIFSSIVLIFHTLIHVVAIPYTRDRYRHPVDFLLIIIGCYGIICFFKWAKVKYFNKH